MSNRSTFEEDQMTCPTPHECEQCDQRNCIKAVELGHLIRQAIFLADDSGSYELARYMKDGMARIIN